MTTRYAPAPAQVRPETLAGLDESQRRAVLTLNGPLLVVAGPGSGKTRVLTRRLAALVDAGVYPSRLLAVTFTNKAAAEMRERLADLIGETEAARAQVSTFHSLCARVLRYHHEAVGLPRQFTILDADDSARVVARAAAAGGYTNGMERSEITQFVRAAQSDISRAKNDALTPADLATSPSPDKRLTGALMEGYNAILTEMGAVDFDDLLTYTHWLLTRVPAAAEQLRQRWSHVSVDEFQDTNAVQYAIVSELVRDHHNLCVVGDADQSIYAFRGAQPSVVRSFTRDYEDVEVVVLDHNYRSTANICAVSKAVIEPNDATYRSPQTTTNPDGSPVTLTGYTSDLDEAREIVDMIRRRGGRRTDHGVLVRTNALTRSLEQALTVAGIDYEVVGATRFYDRAEIKDAMSWLRLVFNPREQMAFARAISVPKRGIGSVTIAKIVETATVEKCTVLEAARRFGEGKTKAAATVADFCGLVDHVADQAQTRGPVAALTAILDLCGVRDVVRERDRKEHTQREENLDQLLAHAGEFVNHPDGPVAAMEAYLESVSLLESTDDAGEGDLPVDRVQILTVHAAKGKEFPHVYVVGLEENVLPHARAIESGDEDELAEERRLMFVATSRAQKTLDLSWCTQRMRFGKVENSLPSRFIEDLPRTQMKVVDPPDPTSWGSTGFSSPRPNRGGARGGWTPGRAVRSGPTWTPGPARTPAAARTPRESLLPRVETGSRVTHAMFGAGTVTEIDAVSDTLRVAFDSGDVKLLSASLAPLTPA